MRIAKSGFAVSGALLMAACGSDALTLPADPVDRAATCGVVAAAEARLAVTDVQAPLPIEAHGRIAHYALLGASAGGIFSPSAANAISRRMSELQERITAGKWRGLAPACASAFPPASKAETRLPEDEFTAQLACHELAGFLGTVLAGQPIAERNERAEYTALHRRLSDRIAPGLQARAGSSPAARRSERHKALAAAAQLGSPVPALRQCLRRFG